jgi:hypothetical protein
MCRNNTPEYTHLTFSQWRALRDEQLSQASGVPGGVFVHANGFIGGHATRCVADVRAGGKHVAADGAAAGRARCVWRSWRRRCREIYFQYTANQRESKEGFSSE